MLEVNQAVAMEMTEGLVQRAKEESKMAKDKKKKLLRYGGGRVWMDHSLDEWDPSKLNISTPHCHGNKLIYKGEHYQPYTDVYC